MQPGVSPHEAMRGAAAGMADWTDDMKPRLLMFLAFTALLSSRLAFGAGMPVAIDEAAETAELGLALTPPPDGSADRTEGARVAALRAGGVAATSGLQVGDLIIRIGDDVIATPAAAAIAIRRAESDRRQAVPLLVMRDGRLYYVALLLPQR